ncbi:hypothetical protein MKW92_051388 [Papaver armeniacum]|nr:hypothetical protein MKW92_051388 [Papaver armeniacum]
MAAQHKYSVIVLFLVFGALVTDFANASSLTVWKAPGCTGGGEVYQGCGCKNINYYAGYYFDYTGQPARLYGSSWCSGSVQARFTSDVRKCSSFGWKSIYIAC